MGVINHLKRAYAEELLGPLLNAEERAGAFIDDGIIEGLERFGEQLEREFGEIGGTAS